METNDKTTEIELIKIKVIKKKHADQLNSVPTQGFKTEDFDLLANVSSMCWVLARQKKNGYLMKVDHAVIIEWFANDQRLSYSEAGQQGRDLVRCLPQLFLD